MKKIFSFFTAMLFAGSMMAQAFDHGLYVPANASVEAASEVGTSASVNTTTGDLTINIGGQHTSWGDWGNQIKLSTGVTGLDETKNYEIGFKAVASTANCPASHVKIFDDNELFHSTTEVYTTTVKEFSTVVRGAASNGIIVWSFTWADAQTVTISDIYVKESSAPVVEDPKPTTAPAAPTADAATVLSVYSNTYAAAAPFGFLEAWGQSTSLEELNLDGNNVLYYKNFNWLGWGCQGTPIDASTCTGLHLDIWAGAAGSIRVVPIYGGAGLTTDDSHGKVVTLVEGWNSVDLNLATDFAGLNLESIFQFKFDQNVGGTFFAFDNVYFTGYTAPTVVYTSLADVRKCAKDSVVTLKDFEVVFAPAADTRYYYIKDATSTCVIYANNYGLVAGDKVAKGLVGTVDIYNGLYEIKPITTKAELTITPGTAPEPVNATAAPTADDQSKYVVYKKVRVAADDAFLSTSKNTVYGIFGKDTIAFYNSFKIAATLEASKEYDIVGINSVYNNPQVLPVSVTEHQGIVDECAGEHGLYDAATAVINDTYLRPSWNEAAGADHTATMENGTIVIHVGAQGYVDMWNGQVFVNPGFSFTPGKAYHYEFDLVSSGKVCITVKVNDSDNDAFFVKALYDLNIGGGTYHFSTDSVFANENINTTKGPLVFGFGWTDANQDVIIKCIKITEIGDAPQPVEEKMYIKHPWGTGKDEDWAWQEMSECKFKNVDAWTYTGAWGGVGFNIADNAEGNNSSWYAAETVQFLDADQALVEAPAVGTEGCEFYFVPSFVGGIVTPAYVVVPVAEGFENNMETVKAVKVIENGKVVIIKNGVRYNALGAQL